MGGRGRKRAVMLQKWWNMRAGEKQAAEWGGGGRGRVSGTLDSSPHRHADLNGGLAPGARH